MGLNVDGRNGIRTRNGRKGAGEALPKPMNNIDSFTNLRFKVYLFQL